MSQQILMSNLTKTPSTTIDFTLGQIYFSPSGGIYQFVKASAAVNQYDFVTVSSDGNYTVAQADTDASPLNTTVKVAPLGCAQVAFAINTYGWIFRGGGAFTGNIKTLAVANAPLYVNGTAGHLDDAIVSGPVGGMVPGVFVLATVGGADAASACWASVERMYCSGIVA